MAEYPPYGRALNRIVIQLMDEILHRLNRSSITRSIVVPRVLSRWVRWRWCRSSSIKRICCYLRLCIALKRVYTPICCTFDNDSGGPQWGLGEGGPPKSPTSLSFWSNPVVYSCRNRLHLQIALTFAICTPRFSLYLLFRIRSSCFFRAVQKGVHIQMQSIPSSVYH